MRPLARGAAWLLALACTWGVGACGQSRPASPGPAASPPRETAVQAQIGRGAELYTADGCAACHSTDGSRGVGPTFKRLASSTVTLASGRRVRATPAYLRRSIADPDAQVVRGYRRGVMARATGGYRLAERPADVRALVQFITSVGP